MADPNDPKRPAPAAQPDVLGGEASNDGTMDGLDGQVGGDGTPRDRGQAQGGGRSEPDEGEARPGRDENQAGFLKDRDKADRP